MASAAGARRHFHRAVQQARFKAHALLVEVLLQQVRVRRGDAGVLQALRAGIFGVERGGQRQTAAAEIEAAQGEVARVFALSAAAEQLFFQHVFADDAQIDHAVHHGPGMSSSRTRRISIGMFSAKAIRRCCCRLI